VRLGDDGLETTDLAGGKQSDLARRRLQRDVATTGHEHLEVSRPVTGVAASDLAPEMFAVMHAISPVVSSLAHRLAYGAFQVLMECTEHAMYPSGEYLLR
jgi:hypothetical protein